MCTVPTRGGKDSVCTVPNGGKTQCVQSPPEEEKTLCVQSQDISNQDQFQNVYIQEKAKKPTSGGQAQTVSSRVGKKQGSQRLIIGLIKDGYKLPFKERPKLSRVPCIISSYAGFDKQNALWTSMQDLLWKGTKSYTPQTVLGSTAVSSWCQNQANAGG